MEHETKDISFKVDVKALRQASEETGEFGYFTGYASTFNNIDRHEDIIVPGAFTDTIKGSPSVKLLWNHDMDDPVGRIMALEEDNMGLKVEGRINLGTGQGRDAYALLKAGDIDSMSIGYVTLESDMDHTTNVRHIKKLELYEISLVTIPANPMAMIMSVKTLDEAESLSDIEKLLRTKGFTKKEVRGIISKVKKFMPQREAVETIAENTQCEADVQEAAKALVAALKGLSLTN